MDDFNLDDDTSIGRITQGGRQERGAATVIWTLALVIALIIGGLVWAGGQKAAPGERGMVTLSRG